LRRRGNVRAFGSRCRYCAGPEMFENYVHLTHRGERVSVVC
jgi:hypothetical protein